jgi:type VI secretion system secreted protein VgrG
LQFGQEIDKNYNLIDPGTEFQNPIKHMYAMFSYDKMMPGAQWTAIWYRNGELVYYETKPWDGAVGGLGYSDWGPSPDAWQPGLYDVQIFIGLEFKVSGQFTVTGEAPTALPTLPPSSTVTPKPSDAPTSTPTSPSTLMPSATPQPAATREPTATPSPLPTKTSTFTPAPPKPTATHFPTWTPTPTRPTATHAPTATERPTAKP